MTFYLNNFDCFIGIKILKFLIQLMEIFYMKQRRKDNNTPLEKKKNFKKSQ